MSEKISALNAMMEPSCFTSIAGVYDMLSARIAVQRGCRVLHVGGYALSAVRLGLPDVGLLTLSENVDAVSRIANSVNVPVIADGDDGYGNHNNVVRLIRELERGGLAGVHIEDQVFPKRCGHMAGKRIVSCEAMVQKIKAAVDTRKDRGFVIIARTDAIAVEGFEAAIDRARSYCEAGADVMFVEAPVDDAQVAAIPKAVGVPALFNWCYRGRSPMPPVEDIRALGYRFILMTDVVFAIATHLRSLYDAISADRGYGDNVHDMISVDAFNEMIGLDEIERSDRRFSTD
jgi:2-methylisocitrate lyase-like PEP mutase family enzyme